MTLATNAAYYQAVADKLREWGWGEFLNFWPGWATRTNGGATMLPQAVTVHHTGGTATATSYLVNPADRPALKVLANIHVDALERRVRFICAGGASHGGYTHQACYDRVIAGTAPLDRDLVPGADSATFSINKRTVGVEVDGRGGKGEWDEWTYRATVAVAAACQIVGKWPVKDAPRVGAHKEHTRRKPGDPWVNMGEFRRDVLACIANPWGPSAVGTVALGARLLSKNGNDAGPDVRELIDALNRRGYKLTNDGLFGPSVEAAVRDVQTKAGLSVDGIVGPDTLTALLGEQNPNQPDGGPTAPDTSTEEPPVLEQPPKVEPPKPAPSAPFRFGQANMRAERFGGLDDASSKRGELLKSKLKCSIYALSEVTETARNAIRDAMGGRGRWKVYEVGYTAVLWDSTKWAHKGTDSVKFKDDEWNGIHGAVRAELVNKETGEQLDVIALHVRPGAITTNAGKQADIALALSLVRPNVPTVIAGDYNTTRTYAVLSAGLARASTTSGLDQTWTSPHMVVRGASTVTPPKPFDHPWWIVNLTLPSSL